MHLPVPLSLSDSLISFLYLPLLSLYPVNTQPDVFGSRGNTILGGLYFPENQKRECVFMLNLRALVCIFVEEYNMYCNLKLKYTVFHKKYFVFVSEN